LLLIHMMQSPTVSKAISGHFTPSSAWRANKSSDEEEDFIYNRDEVVMNAQTDILTPAEVAVVSRVTVRDVHRVIDERILPESFYNATQARSFTRQACVFISFYFRAADRLTSEERQRTILLATGLPKGSPSKKVVQDAFLTIDLGPFWKDVEDGLKRLQAARDMVVSDPEILSGTPVIRGTRVPVYDVAASVAAGIPSDRILSAYPSLQREQVELATMYAEANPQRGRPRLRAPLCSQWVPVHRIR
jgi:uncharacterized protein (DUF433 family)